MNMIPNHVKAYLQTAPLAVSGNGSHNTTYKVACTLAQDFGLNADQLLAAMREYLHLRLREFTLESH